MTLLTEDMIEKAARALLAAIYPERGEVALRQKWVMNSEEYMAEARAALEAVLPDLVEKCAQTAEGPAYEERYRGGPGSNWVVDGSSPYGNGRTDAATAIRSLLNKEDK